MGGPESQFSIDDVTRAHGHSSEHRPELLRSRVCGCFYCLKVFNPENIDEWVDEEQTALCPSCGIDSVIGEASGFPITRAFLTAMKARWFG